MRPSFALIAQLAVATTAWAQAPRPAQPAPPVLIKAGRLIDGRSDAPQSGVGILIDGNRIKTVGPLAQVQGQAKGARVIDLSQMTVLPGFKIGRASCRERVEIAVVAGSLRKQD